MPDLAKETDQQASLDTIRWQIRLTYLGFLAERLWTSFWPFVSVLLGVMGVLMLGLQDELPLEAVWVVAVLALIGGVGSLVWGVLRFRAPRRADVLARLDETLPGRPIQALLDDQAVGRSDPQSMAVWKVHQTRMAARAATAKAVPAKMRIASRDPYGLRYAAALLFAVALMFGSLARIGSVGDAVTTETALANGPTWEGWAESPAYTRRPTLYLNDLDGTIELPVGSLVTLRLYGEVGALSVNETVSGRVTGLEPATDPEQDFSVTQAGTISIDGPGGRAWEIVLVPDSPPNVSVVGLPDSDVMGEMTLPFQASDDYGVEEGEAVIALDLAAVDRRHGLAVTPETRGPLKVTLPMPFSGGRRNFTENVIEDFSEHPWANLPVTISLTVLDASEQAGQSEPRAMILPGRRFFDPVAAALIEQRRDLLWSRVNGKRAAQLLRAVSYQPDDVFRKETDLMRLRRIIRRMELFNDYDMTEEQRDALAKELWDLAVTIEEGDLAGALERLRRAQERLEQAMREGASQAEIDELMQELRRATDDYLQQLSRQAQLDAEQNEENNSQQGDPSQQMMLTQDDIQRMMERIQELMEEGRMAEAEQALRELQELLQNLQMQQAQQGGQNGQNPGQQAMEGLADTLRQQQGLSDQAFRDLQEQFNPDAQSGQSQQNQGRDGGQGRGQEHSQSPGQSGQGQGQQQGQPGGDQQAQEGQGGQQGLEQSLAERQRALRDELRRQQQGLPGAGTPEGQSARDALDRAGRAMENAEDALRGQDFSEAIDQQSQAMDALRDGIRALGEQMAQQQQNQQGQGQAQMGGPQGQSDPLGRPTGEGNPESDLRGYVPGRDDLHGRARDLLGEIQRRFSEGNRSEEEREYLDRLLDRF